MIPGTAAAGTRAAALPRSGTAALWLAALVAAAVHVWPARYRLVNLDGVSYLDVADAWRAGPWMSAVNGYWSPAYSWVLAAAMAIGRPAPQHEYVWLHGVNLMLFVVTLAAFWFLLRELIAESPDHPFGVGGLALVATLLFVWTATTQIVVLLESPDLIPSAAILAACALLLRIRRAPRFGDAVALGATLGVGYLGKAAIFPLAFVFFLTAAVVATRRRARTLAAALLAFGLVAGPWVAALSIQKGRPTFGDAGRINYLWFVNRVVEWPVHWPHWDGPGGRGEPVHRPRRLLESPAVYEFATPLRATYPMWYDPSFWYEGVSPVFELRALLRRLKISGADYFRLFTGDLYNRDYFNPQPALAALLLVTWLVSPRRVRAAPAWVIVVPGTAALALYGLVNVEPRYVAAAVLVVWLALLAAVRVPPEWPGAQFARAIRATLTILLSVAVVAPLVSEAYPGVRRLLRGEPDVENEPWHVATALREAGVTPGTPVGIIGNAQVASRWARLARVRIVAEVPLMDSWRVSSLERPALDAVVGAFARTPARVLLAEQLPPHAAAAGWHQVPSTPYWILPLPGAPQIPSESAPLAAAASGSHPHIR